MLLILEYGTFHSGKPNVFLSGNLKPHEVVEMVITNYVLDNCITATNAHWKEGEEFTKIFPQEIFDNEKKTSSSGRIFGDWMTLSFVRLDILELLQ